MTNSPPERETDFLELVKEVRLGRLLLYYETQRSIPFELMIPISQ